MKPVEVTYTCEYFVKFADSTASSDGVKSETVSVDAESLEPALKELGISGIPAAITINGIVEEDDYSGEIDLKGPFGIVIVFEDKTAKQLTDWYGTAYPGLEKQLDYPGRLRSLWSGEISQREKEIREYRKSLRKEE